MPKDYLTELLTNIQSQLTRVEGKQDDMVQEMQNIKVQTTKTNGGLLQAQKDIKQLETIKGKKLDLEPRTLYVIALCAFVLLIIVATALKVNVKGLI